MVSHAPAPPSPLLGHQWVVDTICQSLSRGRAAHSYLITGPRHVGKATTALAIAQRLLCERGDACGVCRHCKLATRRVHPDLLLLDAPLDRKHIPIKDVHEFLHGIALKPAEAGRKVYVIDGAEALAEEGANALLKTLEEPPPGVVLLLTAPDASTLLPTIVSRCQVIALHPLPSVIVAQHLIDALNVEPARAEAIADASGGCPGWAILATENQNLLDERVKRAAELLDLLAAGRLDRLQNADRLAERWSGHADEVRAVLEIWVDVWRDVLLSAVGAAQGTRSAVSAPSIDRAAAAIGAHGADAALAATLAVGDALNRNANPRLALEQYLLRLPRIGRAGR